MYKETVGTVVSVKKQWWLKINTKTVRKSSLDGAIFPHVIKVVYIVNDIEFYKSKWISAYKNPPEVNSLIKIEYLEEKPKKSKIIL